VRAVAVLLGLGEPPAGRLLVRGEPHVVALVRPARHLRFPQCPRRDWRTASVWGKPLRSFCSPVIPSRYGRPGLRCPAGACGLVRVRFPGQPTRSCRVHPRAPPRPTPRRARRPGPAPRSPSASAGSRSPRVSLTSTRSRPGSRALPCAARGNEAGRATGAVGARSGRSARSRPERASSGGYPSRLTRAWSVTTRRKRA
jgi:hypothetical protein